MILALSASARWRPTGTIIWSVARWVRCVETGVMGELRVHGVLGELRGDCVLGDLRGEGVLTDTLGSAWKRRGA